MHTKTGTSQRTIVLRTRLKPTDPDAVRALVAATGRFSDAEVAIAGELVDECILRGTESGYWFVVAEIGESFVGYACFGPIPCTTASFDLYWIAVEPSSQNGGIGRRLIEDVERQVAESGGTRIYVDTSGREAYTATRAFYERMGYERAAVLKDFYAPGDDKVIFAKVLRQD
ncbi:MAG: GNAT family N-acetyltransferase [Phycisphaerales bacterium]|nr:GNAT family N-acetyltransferase [Phycisphaerales bacterium]